MKTRKSISTRGRFCTDEPIVKSWLEGAWRRENLISDKHSVRQSESVIHSVVLNKIFTLLLQFFFFWFVGESGRKKTRSTRSAEPHLGSPSGSEDLFCYQTRRRRRSLLSESDHEPWRRRRLKHNLNRRCQTEAKPSASAAARHSNVNAH